MEVLGLILSIFLIIVYILKCEENARLRRKYEEREFREFVLRFLEEFTRPHNINNLQWRYDMRVGQIKLTWNKSTSPNVVGQPLVVAVDGSILVDEVVAPDVELYEFQAREGAVVNVSLKADNGTFKSGGVSLDFNVPILEPPAAPTNLKFEVMGVTEVPDPTPLVPSPLG